MSYSIFRIMRSAHRPLIAALVVLLLGCAALAETQAAPKGFSFGERTVVEIAKRLRASVVNIHVTQVRSAERQGGDPFEEFFEFFRRRPRGRPSRRSLGSGVIIDREGHIITNNHVLKDAGEVKVRLLNEREHTARIIGRDEKTDLALLRIDAKEPPPPAPLGDSDALEVGEWVVAIGNPFGLNHTVTVGVVSAKGRVLHTGPYDDFIQTDASINPGNSGGPLLNARGEVVGINTAILSRKGGAANIGIGFAIPINLVKRVYRDLKAHGRVIRGRIGVAIRKVDRTLAKKIGLRGRQGAQVTDVTQGGPAYRAGIRRDDVILEFNGKRIENWEALPRMVAATRPGTMARVKVVRDGKTLDLTVRVGPLETYASKPSPPSEHSLGLSVAALTPELARELGIEAAGKGVAVTWVEKGEPADRAGIRRGDIVAEVNRAPIRTLGDYLRALEKAKGEKSILFVVKRGGGTIFAAVEPE
ncbi:MAG: Do family serine endopeptidase [Nitrospinota bacterium]